MTLHLAYGLPQFLRDLENVNVQSSTFWLALNPLILIPSSSTLTLQKLGVKKQSLLFYIPRIVKFDRALPSLLAVDLVLGTENMGKTLSSFISGRFFGYRISPNLGGGWQPSQTSLDGERCCENGSYSALSLMDNTKQRSTYPRSKERKDLTCIKSLKSRWFGHGAMS